MTLDNLKTAARNLGLSDAEVAEYGNLRYKATWESAIASQEQLNAEISEENHKAAAHRAYQSSSAPVVVPLAYGAAVAETLLRGIGSMLPGRKN